MKKHKDGLALWLANNGMQFLLYHSLMCAVHSFVYGTEYKEDFAYMGLILAPLIVLAVFRAAVKNFFLFFGGHILVCAGMLFAGRSLVERLIFAAAALFITVNSIRFRTRCGNQGEECPRVSSGAVFLVLFFLCNIFEKPQAASLIYGELFLFILLSLVYRSFDNTRRFIKLNKDTANLPEKQMKRMNAVFLAFFLAFTAAFMLLFPMLHLEVLVNGAGRLLLFGIRWFFGLFHYKEGAGEAAGPAGNPKGGMEGLLRGERDTGFLWIILENILKVVLIAAGAAAIIGGLGFLFYTLYKRFYGAREEDGDVKEFLGVQVLSQRLKSFSKKRPKEDTVQSLSLRVRKLYRKRVKRQAGKKARIPEYLTPKELEEYLRNVKERENGLSHEEGERICYIYEKARYGQTEVSQEEWEELKRLLKN